MIGEEASVKKMKTTAILLVFWHVYASMIWHLLTLFKPGGAESACTDFGRL